MLYLKKRKSNDGLKKIIQTMLHLSNLMAISCFTKKKKKMKWLFDKKLFQTMLHLSHVNDGSHNELN